MEQEHGPDGLEYLEAEFLADIALEQQEQEIMGAGPKIGGSSGGKAYLPPDTRPHVDVVEHKWPGAYLLARRLAAREKGLPQAVWDAEFSELRMCIMRGYARNGYADAPGCTVLPGDVGEIAFALLQAARQNRYRLS